MVLAAVAGVVTLSSACSGWRKQGERYYARGPHEATFTFVHPGAGWSPLKISGLQVAWINPKLQGLIELHGQCEEQGDSSLYQYTDHLRIDWTDWVVQEQSEHQLLGRAALRTVAVAKLDGVPRQQELWVVKRAGCLFDLRYGAQPSKFAAGQPHFAAVVKSFTFVQ